MPPQRRQQGGWCRICAGSADIVQTGNDEMAGLERLVPELAKLEQLLAEGNEAQIAALARFASDTNLKRLRDLAEEQRSEFDAIEFLGLSNDEEFHSNFLAWLLDPRQSHGLGDYFLRHFLTRTGAQTAANSPEWSATSVYREWVNEVDGQWGYLDILVVNQAGKFLCAIENKIRSWEHSEQLTRYRKALEERYPDYDRHYVFLSPRGMLPNREEEQEHWTAVSYKAVLQSVEQAIPNNINPIKEDVRAFLQQYANTLRRNIVPDTNTNIAALARQIYLEHREAIELIIKHKPNYFDDVKKRLMEAVAQQEGWTLVTQDDTRDLILFQPDVLEEFEVLKAGEWMPNHLLWFEFWGIEKGDDIGKAWFQIEVAPALNEGKAVREKIVETFRRRGDLFQNETEYDDGGMRWEAPDWLIKDADLGIDWDAGIVRHRVNQFASNEFPSILEIIVNCLREYEAEQDQ